MLSFAVNSMLRSLAKRFGTSNREARKQESKLISSFSVTAISISEDLIPAFMSTLGKQALPSTAMTSSVSVMRRTLSGS